MSVLFVGPHLSLSWCVLPPFSGLMRRKSSSVWWTWYSHLRMKMWGSALLYTLPHAFPVLAVSPCLSDTCLLCPHRGTQTRLSLCVRSSGSAEIRCSRCRAAQSRTLCWPHWKSRIVSLIWHRNGIEQELEDCIHRFAGLRLCYFYLVCVDSCDDISSWVLPTKLGWWSRTLEYPLGST